MKKPRMEELVMSRLFTTRKDIDPNDWQTHVRRNLVPEVRAETVCFYGPTDCLEAQYPGLDYNKLAHRLRLGRFPYHRRLFRVFDELRLMENEIQRLCRWEGTRWAREIYEANNRIKIKDTTWEGVADYKDRATTASRPLLRGGHLEVGPVAVSENMEAEDEGEDDEMDDEADEDDEDDEEEVSEEESDDEVQQSVGVELHQRLLAASEARARGEEVILDADWEQWLKEAAERDAHAGMPHLVQSTSISADATQTPVQWDGEIPDFFIDNPTPEIAAMQLGLPPAPQYHPSPSSSAALVTAASSLSPRTGAAL